MDLRCAGRLHGQMIDSHTIEVKCPRRACGHAPGVVVLHSFNILTGQYTTRLLADPVTENTETSQ